MLRLFFFLLVFICALGANAQERATEDAAKEDAATEDAATKDAATKDAAKEDAATKDAATKDAAKEDAAKEDAATKDAARQDALLKSGDENEALTFKPAPSLEEDIFKDRDERAANLVFRWRIDAGAAPLVGIGKNGEIRSASKRTLSFHNPKSGAVTQKIPLGCNVVGLQDDYVLCERALYRVNRFGEKSLHARYQKRALSVAVFGDDHAVTFDDGSARLERYGGNPQPLQLPTQSVKSVCFDGNGELWTVGPRGKHALTGIDIGATQEPLRIGRRDNQAAFSKKLSGRRYVQVGSQTSFVDDNRPLPPCAHSLADRTPVYSMAITPSRVVASRAKGALWFFSTGDDVLLKEVGRGKKAPIVNGASIFYGGVGFLGLALTPVALSLGVPQSDAFSTSFQSALLMFGSTAGVIGGVVTALGGYGLYLATVPSDFSQHPGSSCATPEVTQICHGFVSTLCCAVGAPTVFVGLAVIVTTPLFIGGALALDPNADDLPFDAIAMNGILSGSTLGVTGLAYGATLLFRDPNETLAQTTLREPVRLFFATGLGAIAAASVYGILHSTR